MQKHHPTIDIIIVGAGIVGLSCALALSLAGFHIALIEAQAHLMQDLPQPSDPFDAKVVAITRASETLFERLEVWSVIQEARVCPYQHMKVWDSVMDGLIEFSAVDYFEDNLGHIIEQKMIIGALWQRLKQFPNVTIMTGAKVNGLTHHEDHIEAELNSGQTLLASLIIAADGANSIVRQLCHISSAGWDYHQSAIVATVEGTLSHHHTAFQRFAPSGPLALLPLANPYQSSIVWTDLPEQATRLMQLDPDAFAQVLTREIDGVMGQMKLRTERFIFPLKTHHAKQYVTDRCALVGDAAHTLHPLAGQGVNLGLLDVAALVGILTSAKEKQRDIGALRLLKKYERKRRLHNQIMIWAMEAFKQGFGSSLPLLQRARNSGLNWVNKHKAVKQIFVKMALGTSSERNSHVKDDALI